MVIYLLNGGGAIQAAVLQYLCIGVFIIFGLLAVGILLYALYAWLFPSQEETKGSQRTMLILLVAGIGVLTYIFGNILWGLLESWGFLE